MMKTSLAWMALLFAWVAHAQTTLPVTPVSVEGRNIAFHVIDDVVVTVKEVNGTLVPRSGKAISLDDKKSFNLGIANAVAYLSADNLSALLNGYILPHAKSPIHDVAVSFDGQSLVIQGSLRKVLDIPFQGRATLDVTPEGNLHAHFTDLTAAGVFKKGFLDSLGLTLSHVAQSKHQPSFAIQGDDVTIAVQRLFPPPHILGKLQAVRIENNQLVEVFGNGDSDLPKPPVDAANFIYFHGGTLEFARLTMSGVDLELVDTNTSTPFDFWLDHYHEQLEAGYIKTLPDMAVIAYLPDYSSLAKKK